MQTKLLNDIVSEIVGKEASNILDLLIGKKDVNEFLIAKKLKLTINQARNIFYKLSNFGLVSFTRKKDKRKGWYTYFWTLNTFRALELLEKRLKKEIEGLEQQLKSRETKRFYLCKTCKTEITEETALLHNFICQECGEVYELNEDKKILNDLRNKIVRLEKQRQDVFQELEKVREEESKRISRREKREQKKKVKKRKELKKEALKIKKRKKKKIKKQKKKLKKKKARKIKKRKKKRGNRKKI